MKTEVKQQLAREQLQNETAILTEFSARFLDLVGNHFSKTRESIGITIKNGHIDGLLFVQDSWVFDAERFNKHHKRFLSGGITKTIASIGQSRGSSTIFVAKACKSTTPAGAMQVLAFFPNGRIWHVATAPFVIKDGKRQLSNTPAVELQPLRIVHSLQWTSNEVTETKSHTEAKPAA